MTELHGFLPLPSVITEPALGYGVNLALVFFHPAKQSLSKDANKDRFNMLSTKLAGGGGFRYLLARWFNLYMGIDVAKGPEPGDWALYIIFGSFWLGR